MTAELLVMRRTVSHNEPSTKKRCCLVFVDVGGSLIKTEDNALQFGETQLGLLFILLSCHQRSRFARTSKQTWEAKIGAENLRGRK